MYVHDRPEFSGSSSYHHNLKYWHFPGVSLAGSFPSGPNVSSTVVFVANDYVPVTPKPAKSCWEIIQKFTVGGKEGDLLFSKTEMLTRHRTPARCVPLFTGELPDV